MWAIVKVIFQLSNEAKTLYKELSFGKVENWLSTYAQNVIKFIFILKNIVVCVISLVLISVTWLFKNKF